MTRVLEVSVTNVPLQGLHSGRARWMWDVLAALLPTLAIAVCAVELTPHARGVGFFLELRLLVLTPVCSLGALGAVLAYRVLAARQRKARAALTAALLSVALVVFSALVSFGPRGLALQALPMLLSVALSLSWFVPRAVDRPDRSWLRLALLVIFGALVGFAALAALASERPLPVSPDGLAFDVPRALFDVEHRFLDLPTGARVHYVDEGQGPILLFLHGNPSWSFQWRDLIRELRSSYRCVALDYPGFGLSEAPTGYGFTPREQSQIVEQFVDRLALRDLTLVMQDWGGPIGLGLAARRPELVLRVVLGSTWAWPTTIAEPRGKFSALVGGPLGEFLQLNFNAFAAAGIEHGIVRTLPEAELALYLRPFRPLDRRGIAAFYPGQINAATDYFTEVAAGLPRLSHKPALLFWALRDRGFPRSDLARFEGAFRNHRTIELPNADHFFFEDSLPLMLQEMRTFLQTPPLPSAP